MYAQSLIRASAPSTFYLITTFRNSGLLSHFRGRRLGTLLELNDLRVKTRVKYTEHYVRAGKTLH